MPRLFALVFAVVSGTAVPAADPPKDVEPLHVFPLPWWEEAKRGYSERVNACTWLEFSTDGKLVGARRATSRKADRLQMWDAMTGKLVREIDLPRASRIGWTDPFEQPWRRKPGAGIEPSSSFQDDSRSVVTLDGSKLLEIPVDPKVEVKNLGTVTANIGFVSSDGDKVRRIASPDSRTFSVVPLVEAAGDQKPITTITLPDPPDSEGGHVRVAVGRSSRLAAFTIDGQLETAAIRLYENGGEKPVRTLTPKMDVWSLTFAPDGKTLAAGNADGTVAFWDTVSGKKRGEAKLGFMSVFALSFTADSGLLLAGTLDVVEKPSVYLVEAATAKVIGELQLKSAVSRVAFSPDGKRFAVHLLSDNSVRVFDTEAVRKAWR